MSKRMQKGFVVNFKPELMDQLEIAGGVVAKRNRLMTFDDVIASVAPSWEKGVRKFSACVERRADTRKKKKDESLTDFLSRLYDSLETEFKQERDTLMAQILVEADAGIKAVVEAINEEAKKRLSNIIVDLNVNDKVIEENMSLEDTAKTETYLAEQASIESQMAALRDRQSALKSKVYGIKRNVVEKAMLEKANEGTKEIILSLRDTPKEDDTNWDLFIN